VEAGAGLGIGLLLFTFIYLTVGLGLEPGRRVAVRGTGCFCFLYALLSDADDHDCLSGNDAKEPGLLFLTNLRSYDVVLGKWRPRRWISFGA